MIAYIAGALVSAGENYIVIDNHGMGYRIFVSGKFLERIPAYGTQIKVYTHMYIREDELTLYGFHSEEDNCSKAISSYISRTLLSIVFLNSYTSEKSEVENPVLKICICLLRSL